MRVNGVRENGIVRRVVLLDHDGDPIRAVCRFLDHMADRNMSPNTLRAYGYGI